jgi:hypothetical protein
MNSPFRPRKRPDPAILDDHSPLLRLLERRGLIRGGLSLGALTMLTGCDVTRPRSVEDALLAMSRLNRASRRFCGEVVERICDVG